ncbi:LuxR C-terminal-related transcriptional regulator [Dietzia sp. SL131]|uniref:LuxR C-terminal-related transcriptional regulator n=1 Tax=Dietzia sp. SL131 TaxID=2995149 RepID=UPI00227A91C0|nr:LuxR C-terminal-related transcriptional regulator [Dietzia sp. SL131]MCY1658245.1 LuxR C-terminal-related transcriptional regulator [Dietzia sp. SL131]
MNWMNGGVGGRPGLHHVAPLTSREVDVLTLWFAGMSKANVGRELYLAESTVSTYIARARSRYENLGLPAGTQGLLLSRAVGDGHVDIGTILDLADRCRRNMGVDLLAG